jgi:replicative DNA helicase
MASDVGTYAEQFGTKFQAHILAVLMRIPGVIVRYRSALDYRFFTSDVHKVIAKALFQHVDAFRFLPSPETLVETARPETDEEMMVSVEEAVGKLSMKDVSDSDAVCLKLVEFGKTQAMVNAVVACADDLKKNKRDKILTRVQEAQLVGEDVVDVGTDYLTTMAEREFWYAANQDNNDTIPTGIRHLDLAMGGGLGRGELGVVLASPKRGKTGVLVNIGFGALMSTRNLNVIHYSMEIVESNAKSRPHKVSKRYDDRLACHAIRMKHADPAKYAEILRKKAQMFIHGQLYVKSYPTRQAGVSTVRNHLSLMASKGFHPDLVIVDYADIMRPERRMGEVRHEQAGIYEDLRALAAEFDAAVWTASQTNRGALDKETVTIADFAEAFEKAAIVDAAAALCQTNAERMEGRCRLFMAALRNEEDGRTVECEFMRDRCYVRSTGLLDAGFNRMFDAGEEEGDPTAQTETKTTVHAPKAPEPPKPPKKPFTGRRTPKKPSKRIG